jgi:preprotein translocase subunit SecF
VLAAVLAVLGYSVNESVVIFDRIPRDLPQVQQTDNDRR